VHTVEKLRGKTQELGESLNGLDGDTEGVGDFGECLRPRFLFPLLVGGQLAPFDPRRLGHFFPAAVLSIDA
jgi:hypothetical protein